MPRRSCLAPAVALFAAALLPAAALAQSARWTNPQGGSFADPANWDTGSVPTATATFDLPLAYTVTFPSDTAIQNITTAAGDVTLDLGAHQLSVSGTARTDAGTLHIAHGVLRGSILAHGAGLCQAMRNSFQASGTKTAWHSDSCLTAKVHRQLFAAGFH
jgi:hypothetical protein